MQNVKIIERKNERLTEQNEYAKAVWPKLSNMMGDSIMRKSRLKIIVNDTRYRHSIWNRPSPLVITSRVITISNLPFNAIRHFFCKSVL